MKWKKDYNVNLQDLWTKKNSYDNNKEFIVTLSVMIF